MTTDLPDGGPDDGTPLVDRSGIVVGISMSAMEEDRRVHFVQPSFMALMEGVFHEKLAGFRRRVPASAFALESRKSAAIGNIDSQDLRVFRQFLDACFDEKGELTGESGAPCEIAKRARADNALFGVVTFSLMGRNAVADIVFADDINQQYRVLIRNFGSPEEPDRQVVMYSEKDKLDSTLLADVESFVGDELFWY